jgi:hypothetical protein
MGAEGQGAALKANMIVKCFFSDSPFKNIEKANLIVKCFFQIFPSKIWTKI